MEEFNTYLAGIDCRFFRDFCRDRGRRLCYRRGDLFERAGETARFVGYVGSGVFRHRCTASDGKVYSTGFAFSGEFIADYPACLYGWPAATDIQAVTDCEVYVCDAAELQRWYEDEASGDVRARKVAEQLFLQLYATYLDAYRKTPEERYRELLRRCPRLLQVITLKELASYLKITPTTLSTIRRRITFGG